MTKKKPQNIVDPAPELEDLIAQPAPDIDDLIADLRPEEELLDAPQDPPAPIPLEAMPELTFIDRDGRLYKLDTWRPQGSFILRPYSGA